MNKKMLQVAPYLCLASVVMLVFAVISLFFSKIIFFVEMLIAIVGIVVSGVIYLRADSFLKIIVKNVVQRTKGVDRRYLERFKFPVAAVDSDDNIIWYNTAFYENICSGNDAFGMSILPLLGGRTAEVFCTAKGGNVELENKKFTLYSNSTDTGYILYFFDDTYYKDVEKEYNDSRLSVAMIVLDNGGAFESDDEDEAVRITIQVESLLQRYATDYNALYRKMAQGRYMLIVEERELQKIIETKFDILSKVREFGTEDTSVSLSVGIGRGENDLRKSQAAAKKALDMALGRGGDQVAILTDGEFEFFGGKTAGVERQSKVRIRVITRSIINAIQESDRVIITGHKFSDLDCVGAAVGLYGAITTAFKKETYIAVNYQTSMAKGLIDTYASQRGGEVFISPEKALDLVTENTLLIVVDTQSINRMENSKLYEMCENIIVIDHHRMSVDHIENALVFFHEPSASSASEMCVELIDNFPDGSIKKAEAEALLSGIILDTKNFVINSGARTFEAASFLKKHGADTVSVRGLFSDSIDIYRNKYKLVSTARIYKKCAIVIADEDMADIRLIASKAADELLGLTGVNASFVVFRTDSNTLNISARSYGKRNVQLIMERLGGGGHHSMAAAQLKDTSFESAVRLLVESIDKE